MTTLKVNDNVNKTRKQQDKLWLFMLNLKIKMSCQIFTLLGTAFFLSPSIANQLSVCNSCSETQKRIAVQALPANSGFTYVADMHQETLDKFLWVSDHELSIYFLEKLTLTNSELSVFDDFTYYNTRALNLLAAEPNLLNQIVSEYDEHTNYNNETPIVFSFSNHRQSTSCASGIGAADFITDSQLRKHVFDKMNTRYPVIQAAFTHWNNLAMVLNIERGGVSVDASILTISQRVNFPDGSTLKVVVDNSNSTFEVLNGSAFDCNNNQLPTRHEGFLGGFSFGNEFLQAAFSDYATLFGVETIVVPICRSQFISYQTRCSQSSEDPSRHFCTADVPNDDC